MDLYYKMDDGLLHGSNKLQDFKQTLTKYNKKQLGEIEEALG